MATTPILGLRYPASGDPADVPADMQNLATDVDNAAVILQGKKSIISAEQSRTNTAYGYLGTEDKVTGVVMPTDGLIAVLFQALWKNSDVGAGRAALFIGANQLKARHVNTNDPFSVAAKGSVDSYNVLSTVGPVGLAGGNDDASTSDVTTGQTLGVVDGAVLAYDETNAANLTLSSEGPYPTVTYIHAAAGTYEVGVKTKSSSGSVTMKERKLWVWTMAFD